MASYMVYFTYTDNNGRKAEINSGPHTLDEAKQVRRDYEQLAADGTKGTAQIKKVRTDTTSWYRSESKFIKASDDWYPNYPDGTIKLTILARCYDEHYSYIKIYAEDMNDFMMEKAISVTENTKEAVKEMFEALKATVYDAIPENVSRKWFYERDFIVD